MGDPPNNDLRKKKKKKKKIRKKKILQQNEIGITQRMREISTTYEGMRRRIARSLLKSGHSSLNQY